MKCSIAVNFRLLYCSKSDLNDSNAMRPGRRPKRFRRRQLFILQGLPHVGPKLAIQLLNYFGNIEGVITASSKELTKIPGLGKIKAQKIREIVTSKVKYMCITTVSIR